MSRSWSELRKQLEQEWLCPSLRGRVQYFCTHYHGAPDNYGRFCIRVDGEEHVMANPYNEGRVDRVAYRIKEERSIPPREWNGKDYLYGAENTAVENEASHIMANEGIFETWFIFDAISIYLSSPIAESLASPDPVVRLFAILDRRVGKRTLERLVDQVDAQPEWLRFFYRLRLEAEGISRKKTVQTAHRHV